MNKTKTRIAKNWSPSIHFRCNKKNLIAPFLKKSKKVFVTSLCEIENFELKYNANLYLF